jgi:8-oxo-dGTP diphosphatase
VGTPFYPLVPFGGVEMIFPTHIVAVSALIRDENNKVLLMKHPKRGWEFPGGQVETGEDLISALIREIEEETGIKARIDRLVGVYSNTQITSQYDGINPIPTKVIFGFLGYKVSGELRTSNESLEVGWHDHEEALKLCNHPTIKDRLKDMLKFDGNIIYRSYKSRPYEIQVEQKI